MMLKTRAFSTFTRLMKPHLVTQKNVVQFFNKISSDASKPYWEICENLSKINLPSKPTKWEFKSGWYRYEAGKEPVKVEYPEEDAITFDMEVLYKISPFPTLATCASEKAWYGWVSPYLVGEKPNPADLIPINPTNSPKLILGHNVGFDRSKTKDDYATFGNSNSFFMDTASLYYLSSYRISKKSDRSISEHLNAYEDLFRDNKCTSLFYRTMPYGMYTLGDLSRKILGKTMDKSIRDYFDAFKKEPVVDDFQNVMNYCALDVSSTHEIYKVLWDRFKIVVDQPMEFIALKEMGNNKLIFNKSKWDTFVKTCAEKTKQIPKDVSKELAKIAASKGIECPNIKHKNAPEVLDIKWKNTFPVRASNGTSFRAIGGDPSVKLSPFNKSEQVLWENGTLTCDPGLKYLVDRYFSSLFWNFARKVKELNYVKIEDQEDLVTVLPTIKTAGTQSGEPYELLWMNDHNSNVIGKDYRNQLAAPSGYDYVSLTLDQDLINSAILEQEKLSLVSPYLIRDFLDSVKVRYLYLMITALSYLFKQAGMKNFQLISTFSNEVRYLVKDNEKSKAEEILHKANSLAKLYFKDSFPHISSLFNTKDVELPLDGELEENSGAISTFSRFKNLYATQIFLQKATIRQLPR